MVNALDKWLHLDIIVNRFTKRMQVQPNLTKGHTMNESKFPAAVITAGYRERLGLTYRAFADALAEHLVNGGVTHATIMNWEKGITDPNERFVLTCLATYQDWRRQWAIDVLCGTLPEVFERENNNIRMLV